jgi:hypothetical protein
LVRGAPGQYFAAALSMCGATALAVGSPWETDVGGGGDNVASVLTGPEGQAAPLVGSAVILTERPLYLDTRDPLGQGVLITSLDGFVVLEAADKITKGAQRFQWILQVLSFWPPV